MAYNPFGGAVRGAVIGEDPRLRGLQSEQYRQQTMASQQAAQDQIRRNEQLNAESTARQRAADTEVGLMADASNPRTTNGLEMQISNQGSAGGGGGGSAPRASSGINIGGSTYPDISRLMSDFQSVQGQLGSAQVPNRIPPPQVPSTKNAFARAKDVSGRTGNAALEALRNSFTQRGISDSGLAGMGEANILGNVARQQSDAEYEAANTDNTRQWNANQMAYQGDIDQNQMEYQAAVGEKQRNMQLLQMLMSQLY